MKNILKTSIKILVLCFAITLVNCEKDDEIVSINNELKQKSLFQFKVSSFNELNKNDKFKSAYNKTIKLSTSNSILKTGMEETYGFDIDSSSINELVSSNLTSYTMLIHREEPNVAFFENLVVEIDSLNQIEAYIIKYNYNVAAQTIYNEAHNAFGLDAFVEITPIDYAASTAKVTCQGMYIAYCSWGGSEHVAGDRCTETYGGSIVTVCSGSGSDGNGHVEVGTSGTPNGGDPVDNPDVYTATVTPTMAEQISNFMTLTNAQIIWANKQNQNLITEITTYLLINCGQYDTLDNCINAQAFVGEAIDTLTNDEVESFHEFVELNRTYFGKKEEDGSTIVYIDNFLPCFDTINNQNGYHDITIYVDQPVANSDQINDGYNAGHTFIEITQAVGGTNGTVTTQFIGFYPEGDNITPNNPSGLGAFYDDSGHEYDVSLTVEVSPTQFNTIINYLNSFVIDANGNYVDNITYDLNEFNCSDFGVNIINMTDVQVPDSVAEWGGEFNYALGSGTCPALLGQDIRNTDFGANAPKNTNGGNALSSTDNFDCD